MQMVICETANIFINVNDVHFLFSSTWRPTTDPDAVPTTTTRDPWGPRNKINLSFHSLIVIRSQFMYYLISADAPVGGGDN